MDDRLPRLQRLTSALATRKRAYELRIAQINARIAGLAQEQEQVMAAADTGREPFPGANLHYIKRLEVIGRQLSGLRSEINQLSVLHLKAGADLRRSEIIHGREQEHVLRQQQSRYLEQVIDTALQSRRS